MSDAVLLDRMIADGAKVDLVPVGTKHKAVLMDAPDAPARLEILNVPADALVIRIDQCFDNTRLISSLNGARQRSDFLIVSEAKERILFIEIKAGEASANAIKQLQGSLCALRYCQCIAEQFHNTPKFLSNYSQRFVVFRRIRGRKKTTKIVRQSGKGHQVSKPMKINGDRVQFNEIAA